MEYFGQETERTATGSEAGGGCYLEEVFWWRPVFITQDGGREVAGQLMEFGG